MLFFDTETAPIVPGLAAPPLACLQYARDDDRPRIVRAQDGAAALVWQALEAGETVVGHNVPYDLAVLLNDTLQRHGPARYRAALAGVYRALDEGRVRDTFVRELLKAAADGTIQGSRRGAFSLDACAQRYGFKALDKPKGSKGWDAAAYLLDTGPASDDTALSYWGLRDTPVHAWPQRHVDYAREDVEATRHVYRAQPADQPTEAAQVRGAWALHVTAANGLRVDPEQVAKVRAAQQDVSDQARGALLACGLLTVDRKGDHVSRKLLQTWVTDVLGDEVPKTDSGLVATDADTLGRIAAHVPQVAAYLQRAKAEKLLTAFLPALERGLTVHTRYVPVVSTGRTSSNGPNVQNLPRAPGVRECFVPRPGNVFSSCDYKTLELRTFAQVCHALGFDSRMRDALIAGDDLHQAFADSVHALTGTPVVRDAAKGCNFGFPGGMGAASAVEYLRGYNVTVTEQEARGLKQAWVSTWTEAPAFFQHVSGLSIGGGIHNVTCPVTGFRRGACFFTAACNTHFQGLAGYGNKAALYAVVKACHLDPALDGTFTVASIHDEALCEHPETRAAEHSARVAEIMAREMERSATPDVPQVVEPTLMQRWSKKAKPVFNDGVLVPWDAPEAL